MATHPQHTLERLCTTDLQEKADVAHGEALAGIRPPGVHPVPSCMSAVTAGSRSAHHLQGSSRACKAPVGHVECRYMRSRERVWPSAVLWHLKF